MDDPSEITAVTLAPKLEVLPTQDMEWPNFEALLRRLARQVRGLVQVQPYGVRGQKQYGVDIVGRAPDGTYEAIQSKKYVTFTKADLTAAVTKFLDERDGLPFGVSTLIVAAACDIARTEIVDELYRLTDDTPGLTIELWGRQQICDMVRDRRDIVTVFFGETAAELFCLPDDTHVVSAPPINRVNVADAAIIGPAHAVSADTHLSEATRVEADDPARIEEALASLVEQAEALRTRAGATSLSATIRGVHHVLGTTP